MAELYRKSSLDKISSPDRLDCMLTVTSPMSWVGIIVIGIICLLVIIWSFVGSIPNVTDASGIVLDKTGVNAIYSEKSGFVEQILVNTGDRVAIGTIIAKIKCKDNETYNIISDQNGKVADICFEIGEHISAFSEVIRITPDVQNENVAVCYVSLTDSGKVKNGMLVNIFLDDNAKGNGISAEVVCVDKYSATMRGISEILGEDGQISSVFTSNGPVVAVSCSIKDEEFEQVRNGELFTCQIVTSEIAPIVKVFPSLGRTE